MRFFRIQPVNGKFTDKAVETILWLLFAMVSISAIITVYSIAESAVVPGPNTVGEAGKVWYAERIIKGEKIFLRADQPPYYPPMHGLLHFGSVSAIGSVLDLNFSQLYFAGRAISMLCTLAALILALSVLRRLNLWRDWQVLGVLLLLSYYPVLQHTASYRPDNWLLFVAMLACYLLVIKSNRVIFLILSVLPTVAFLIKATGLTIGLSTFICLLMQKKWRELMTYTALSASVLLMMLWALYWYSGGAYFLSFARGLNVGYSLNHALILVLQPYLFLTVAIPIVLIKHVWPIHSGSQQALFFVFVFYLVEFACNFCFSLRGGSNVYYFISAYFLGTILLVKWLSSITNSRSSRYREAILLCLVLVVLKISQAAIFSTSSLKEDVAVLKTKKYAEDRPIAAKFINSKNWTCYSDDAGLNVMLERPLVICPLLYQLLLESGVVAYPTISDRIAAKEIDVVILTDLQWTYRNIVNVPPSLITEIKRHYVETPLIDGVGYRIFRPR